MNGLNFVLAICISIVLLPEKGDAIMCSVCDTEVDGWECVTSPPHQQACPGYDFCINVSHYSDTGKIKSFTRSCSPFEFPAACLPGVNKQTGESIRVCYTTCNTDGCNSDRSFHHLIDLLRRRRRK